MTASNIQAAPTPTGTFNYAALASARAFDPSDFVTDRSILGLNREAGYIWGTLRDDDGVLYSIMRRISGTPPDGAEDGRQSLGGKLIVTSSGTGKPGLQLRKEPRYAANSADISPRLSDDGSAAILASAPDAAGEPMQLVLSRNAFRYSERSVIDMSGSLVATPLQWYLPGRDSSLLYITQTFLVEGEILGRPARGFLFWEEAWMYPGGRLYRAKDPLLEADYFTWYSWANHYADGSTEIGHYLFGHHNFHVGVSAHSDGTVTSAAQMDAVINRADDGYWHDGISYRIDGADWVCEPDPDGHMRGLGEMPNPQQEGRMHRVGDDRKPEIWMAWGESVPSVGDARRR